MRGLCRDGAHAVRLAFERGIIVLEVQERMDEKTLAERLEEMRAYIVGEVRGGFMPIGDIPAAAIAYAEGDDQSDALLPYADRFTAEALVALSEEQKSWPATTDCDRIDAAFADLEGQGIVARQDFSCCQSCGHGEIWDEMQEALDSGRRVTGYAFCHQQDTESAVQGHGLHLAYGATEEGDGPARAVAATVVAALQKRGLVVTWDGGVSTRILVAIDWKRRRE